MFVISNFVQQDMIDISIYALHIFSEFVSVWKCFMWLNIYRWFMLTSIFFRITIQHLHKQLMLEMLLTADILWMDLTFLVLKTEIFTRRMDFLLWKGWFHEKMSKHTEEGSSKSAVERYLLTTEVVWFIKTIVMFLPVICKDYAFENMICILYKKVLLWFTL